jgi:hypothetical protein
VFVDRVLARGAVEAARRRVQEPRHADTARELREPGVPMIVLETAQPAKFEETIREICEEVAAKAEVKLKIAHNRDNILFLEQYEPTLHSEIRMGYMDRDLWVQLQNPIYTDKGGIIPIMGKTIIQQLVQMAA